MASDFEVEVILNSLQELQREKLSNEGVLAELVARRKQLEENLEEVMARHAIAREKNIKMAEAVKVAEQQVATKCAEVKMLEELNRVKRQRISELKEKIAAAQEQKQKQLHSFEDRMTTLTDKFRNAMDFYSEETVDTEIAKCKSKTAELSSQAETMAANLDQLKLKLQELQSRELSRQQDVVPVSTWKLVREMFEANNAGTKVDIQKSLDSLQEAHIQFSSLSQTLRELEEEADSNASREE